MAAHLEGKGIVTQDAAGLAQKGGATWSHIQIANRPDAILSTKVGTAEADLVIGCDPIVAANKATLAVMRDGRTYVALNTHAHADRGLRQQPRLAVPGRQLRVAVARARSAPDHVGKLDADTLAVQLLGDSIYTNPLMLGYAWQQGRVPLSHAALMRAIELNGVQVENNKAAFEWGRRAAARPAGGEGAGPHRPGDRAGEALDQPRRHDRQARRVPHRLPERGLRRAVQAPSSTRCAPRPSSCSRARDAARRSRPSTKLTEAVARYLFKLMAYKDEYEVARLHSDRGFLDKVAAQFEGEMGKDYQLAYHLAPPAIAKRNDKGELQKQQLRAVDAVGVSPARAS